MKYSIGKKIAYAFLVILMISFLIAGGVGAYLFNDMVQTNLRDDVVHDLDAADALYQYHLDETENLVIYTSGFSRIRDPLVNYDSEMLRQQVVDIYEERFSNKVDIFTVIDSNGVVVARARNPDLYGDYVGDNELIRLALNDEAVSSTEIMSREELLKEDESLVEQAYMKFTPTQKAKPRPENESTSGMAFMAASPVHDNQGNVIGVLYVADLINRDYTLVDRIKNVLYKDEIYGSRDVGTATIFQEDFRISTNVPTDTGERAITTRVSEEVNEAVLEGGEYWYGRAFVVNAWYVTAYKPIKNINGDSIGMFYVGILEQPYIDTGYRILTIYMLYLISGFILSMFITHYFTRSLTQPINKLIRGTEAIAKGKFVEIDVGTEDEIGTLADAFNEMEKNLQRLMGELVVSTEQKTEQKMLDELRESYENLENEYRELQEMDTMKSELVANISHEIRTPLTSIRGYTELMLDNALGSTTETQRKSLIVVLRNIDRLTRLVTNAVDISRLDTVELNLSPVNMNHLLDNIVADFAKVTSDKDINFSLDVADDLLVEGDEDRLMQVATNLLENAVKFSEVGGEIIIKAYQEDEDHIHIEFYDSGVGVPEDKLEKIFDKFYQVDGSSTRKFGGTGLGLAISKRIIERHNGTIWAQRRLERGSVFHIILPVEQRPQSS
jgi:two-component system NtrC family sensor kinase